MSGPAPPGSVRDKLTVLLWHSVGPSWAYRRGPDEGVRGFEQQLAYCARYLNVVSLHQALAARAGGRPLPRRAVALTFDDGYRDCLTRIGPLLKRHGLPATFFLVPGLLSREVSAWWEDLGWIIHQASRPPTVVAGEPLPLGRGGAPNRRALYARAAAILKKLDSRQRAEALRAMRQDCQPSGRFDSRDLFLDWAEAEKLRDLGFEIGSHSLRHDILAKEPAAAQRADLADSRALLEEKLEIPVSILAYPNGTPDDFDETTVDAADRAGYDFAVTTVPARSTRLTAALQIGRFDLRPEMGWRAGLAAVSRPARNRLRALRR